MLMYLVCLSVVDLEAQGNSVDSIRSQYHLALQQNDLKEATASAYLLVGEFRNIKVDSSIVWVKKALAHAEEGGDHRMAIKMLLNYSELNFIRNNTLSALSLAEKADSLLGYYPNDTLLIECLFRRAEGNEYRGEPEFAMDLYLSCFDLAEKISDIGMLIKLSKKIGHINLINDDYQEAVTYFRKGLNYSRNSTEHEAVRWVLLASICQVQVENPSVFDEDEILKGCKAMKEFFQPSNLLINHPVSIFVKDVQVSCIIKYGTQAEIDKLVLTPLDTIKQESINEVYFFGKLRRNFQIALKQQKIYEANLYLQELKNYVERADTEGIEKVVLIDEISYLEATKNYKRHVEVLQRLHVIQLKLENNGRMGGFANLEGKLEAKEKEHENKLLAAQSKQNKTIAFGVSLLAILAFLLFRNSLIKNKKIAVQNAEILDKNIELESLNETKDQLFAIIGHDLRKPASSFRGISKKVKYLINKHDFETLDKYGSQIERNALSLNKLTNNLLNWALMQRNVMPHNPQMVSISHIAADIQTIFETPAREKRILIINKMPASFFVYADPMALSTIFTNLIDNAIKYTPKGGQIVLDSFEESEKQLKVRISDTGIGMDQDQLKNLFLLKKDKSTRGTSGESGTGLGLHLVKELAELDKGVIYAVSKLGEGTTFEWLLPRGKEVV